VVNTSDADIVSAFGTSGVRAAVAWNPQLSVIKKTPQTSEVFSSAQVPGELIDMMVVNTQTLKDNPALGKALTGAWFEMMDKMHAGDVQVLNAMAADSGTDLAGYQAQLKTTHLFWTPPNPDVYLRPELAKTCSGWRSSRLIKGCWVKGRKAPTLSACASPVTSPSAIAPIPDCASTTAT
jgi:NitT/TauT family transport system substrate-binding protein